ncbi:glycosyltransferase family 4 protein [Microbacterium sp. P03]|uniref:glycosyltransferase family 4 protein n=1 Tax=Microbacterium sp. P03 TaxID=3366946 RepID=UPI003746D0D0
MRLISRRARLYESIRTAHLERARELVPAAIVYRVRRYDFDESLAAGLELVQANPLAAALLLRRARLDALEINEPLMASSLPASALAVFAVRFARRSRPRIVTYVIGNASPFSAPSPSLKRRARWAVERMLASYVWKRTDAVAYGTPGARDVYRDALPPRPGVRETLIPALPARSAPPETDRALRVVFLGAFVARKGLPLLIDAWPEVLRARPEATLSLLGKGVLLDDARRFAHAHDSVDLVEDPPRGVIRETLARSLVLVLPSQASPTWREQVGLPIVEGLEQGCAIVTTTETGLAPWLADHGHGVVPVASDASALAQAIINQLDAGDRSELILASLPSQDGRLAADAWMFGDIASASGMGGSDG